MDLSSGPHVQAVVRDVTDRKDARHIRLEALSVDVNRLAVQIERPVGNRPELGRQAPEHEDRIAVERDRLVVGAAGQMSDERLQYKLDFYDWFLGYAKDLRDQGKSLIITGDFNTAHNEIDLKNPGPNSKRSGFLPIERDILDRMIDMGYVDTFRYFHPDTVKYSWWSYRFSARKNNAGWRIDYFFVTRDLIENGIVKEAFIDNDIFGSDHCPVGLVVRV